MRVPPSEGWEPLVLQSVTSMPSETVRYSKFTSVNYL